MYQIMQQNRHTFHIPVMGLAYTIDSPIKVAKYGISSVVSITDDELIEKMRAFYSQKFSLPYLEITSKSHDCRAERIKSYLNLVDVDGHVAGNPSIIFSSYISCFFNSKISFILYGCFFLILFR